MPPKKGKKGKGKKAGGKKGAGGPKVKKLKKVPEGLHTSEMTKGQLMSFVKRLLAEDEREKVEKTLFMLEKSKLFSYWTLCMEKVKMLKDEVRISTVKRDKAEDGREAERDYQNHKLRALENEEIKNFGRIRLQHLKHTKKSSNEIWDIENIFRGGALVKRMQVRTQMRAMFEILRSLHTAHAQSLQDMVLNLSKSIRSKETVWERHFDSRWDTAHATLTKKDKLVTTMKLNNLFMMNDTHEKFLQDLKTFFNDMTANNFAVISSLEQEIDDLKSQNNRLNRDLRYAKANYVAVTNPLEKMQNELTVWKDEPEALERKATEVQNNGKTLESKLNCENNLRILIEVLIQRLEIAQKDFNRVESAFAKGLVKMQQKMNMTNFVNNLKLRAAQRDTVILQAIHPAAKKGDTSLLRKLEHSIDNQQRNIRHSIRQSLRPPSCNNPSTVDEEMRDYGTGQKRREGVILPPILTTKNYKCMYSNRGKAQNIQSHIHYRGPHYQAKPTTRDLGYGYFYIPTSDLTPPRSREDLIKETTTQKVSPNPPFEGRMPLCTITGRPPGSVVMDE